MATSREERMQQRMRGAGRHEVADDSFGFVVPGAEPSSDIPRPAPAIRSEPNTSAKRRKLSPPEPATASQESRSSASRRSARQTASKADPYSTLQDESSENAPGRQPAADPVSEEARNNDAETASSPAVIQRPVSRDSIAPGISSDLLAEEVTESPATAPGSGHRRRISAIDVVSQSAKLQRAVLDEDAGATAEVTTSSPLARKSRNSGAARSTLSAQPIRRRSTRLSQESPIEKVVESPTTSRPPRKSDSTVTTGSARSTRSQDRRSTLISEVHELDVLSSPPVAASSGSARKPRLRLKKSKPVPEPLVAEEDQENEEQAGADEGEEEAEEIDAHEVARRIGRKRPRVSPPRGESPELHSQLAGTSRTTKRRRQRGMQDSPAQQLQPKVRKPQGKPRAKRQSDGEAIAVTVQRYTRPLHRNENDTEEDILTADIPFANRSGVNVVDVLSQMCDEVIESQLAKLHEAAVGARDATAKKELRTKLRAVEAFQEELRTRLLEHTIALDTMHALKKRVRSVQKEKLALRNEILRIRAEREQVALKMDAVRIRHETVNKESQHQLGLSSTMEDIELAIESGKVAPKLSTKDQKNAELANLELLISRVAGQVSAAGDGGGHVNQIRDFNAFLESAAVALEGK